jgi:hypothetical protein
MPTFPRSCNPVCLPLGSGLLGMLLLSNLSIDPQLPGLLEDCGGLAVLMLPLASFKVVMPPALSSREFFNITAAASPLE